MIYCLSRKNLELTFKFRVKLLGPTNLCNEKVGLEFKMHIYDDCLLSSSTSTKLSSNFCPWPTACWKGICLVKFWRPISPAVAMATQTNYLRIKKKEKKTPRSLSCIKLSFLMSLSTVCCVFSVFGAAVTDENQFSHMLFVKTLIKHFLKINLLDV